MPGQAPEFVLGDLGVGACPIGHEPVRETADCERAAAALGTPYLPSLNRGVDGTGASCQFLAGHSGGGCEQNCMVVTDALYTVQYQLACRPLANIEDGDCYEHGVDFEGWDGHTNRPRVAVGAAAARDCQAKCAENRFCNFFTVFPADGRCYLKTSDAGRRLDRNGVSGPSHCPGDSRPTLAPKGPDCFERGVNMGGAPNKRIVVTGYDGAHECQFLCAQHGGCKFFTVYTKLGRCYFFGDDSGKQDAPADVVSGPSACLVDTV